MDHRPVDLHEPDHQAVFLLLGIAAQDVTGQDRHQGQRQDQRSGQGEHQGQRHGLEQLALDALEGQDRQEHDGDDELAVHGRLADFESRIVHRLEDGALAVRILEPADAVLDHDHRTVDDQAEVDGAQAHQRSGDAEPQHALGGEHHRQRDGQGHDQPRPQVAQEDEEDRNHQDRPFEQVLPHRLENLVHQLGPLVDRLDLHPCGQGRLDLLHALAHAAGDLVAVLAHQHEAQAQDDLALARGRGGPAPDLVAFDHLADVADAHRNPVVRDDDDGRDLFDVPGQADALHQVQFAGLDHVAAADVHVVPRERREHVVQGQAELDQLVRIGQHLVLLALAAPGVDLGHAGHRLQTRLDDPVMKRGQLLQRVAVAGHDVVVDLAQAGGHRAHLGLVDAGRKFDGLQPLHDELPREVDVGSVVEGGGHLAQAELRDRPDPLQVGQARDGPFHRKGDLLLDLQRATGTARWC